MNNDVMLGLYLVLGLLATLLIIMSPFIYITIAVKTDWFPWERSRKRQLDLEVRRYWEEYWEDMDKQEKKREEQHIQMINRTILSKDGATRIYL